MICHRCDTELGPELESGHRRCPKCLMFWFMHPKGTEGEAAEARAEWKEKEKNKPTYGQQVVEILDSLFEHTDWVITWFLPEEYFIARHELLAQPDLLTARKYVKEKEE